MKTLVLLLFVVLLFSCEKESGPEVDSFFSKLNILTLKKTIILNNILNTNTTRTERGGPYIPVEATNCKGTGCDIKPLPSYGIGKQVNRAREPILKYEPNHPDANKEGYVTYPNISLEEEKQKLDKVKMAIEFLLKTMPVSHKFFFTEKAQSILKKYPAVDAEYNFKKLIEE